MTFFNKEEPLGLPKGSVRAILALGVTAAFIANMVPLEIAGIVVTYYFAHRATQ